MGSLLLGGEGVADLLQQGQLSVFLIFSLFLADPCVELLDGQHYGEVHCRCNQQEVDNSSQENANLNLAEDQERAGISTD